MPDIRSDTKPVFVRGCTPQIGKSSYEVTTSSDQEKSRDAVIEDAGPAVVEVTEDEFVSNLLPEVPCPHETLLKIIHWVKVESGEYSKGRWTAFKQDPQSYKIKEDQVFSRLGNIVNAIQRAVEACAGGLLELKTRYISIPSKAPECSQRYNLTRPDGCFVFNRPRSIGKAVPDWMDIALTGEFKKDENITKKINDDIKKELWNIHHSMREDAVRTRGWGFTIENRTMRMWYAGRADIIVSKPVDFMTSPDYIIRLFLSFMYASERSMGWDPTMICDWDGNADVEPQYKIKVQSPATADSPSVIKWFRTIKLISAVGAEAIRGRGTRVWRVREILDDGTLSDQTSILKDGWVDSDRKYEADMIAEIEEDAKTLDRADRDALIPCLLTPLIAGPVVLDDGTIDSTLGGRRRERWYGPKQSKFQLTQVSPAKSPTPSVKSSKPVSRKHKSPKSTKGRKSTPRTGKKRVAGDPRDASPTQSQTNIVAYGRKDHYRIVFKEDCEVLHEITSLRRVVYALTKACAALRALHKLGWVHRDISSGNILLFKKQVKITDFEYAKKLDLPGKVCHDIRTGTEDFMAVEVRLRAFKFINNEDHDPLDQTILGTIAEMDDDSDLPTATRVTGSRLSRTYTWFYNPLHDLESIWWIFKSVLLNKDIVCQRKDSASFEIKDPYIFAEETDEERTRRIIYHWQATRSLFSGRTSRADFAYSKGVLVDFLTYHPLHPAIRPLAEILEGMRETLAFRYQHVEKNPSTIDHTSAETVHEKFGKFLWNAWNHMRSTQCDIQLRSLGSQAEAISPSIRHAIIAEDIAKEKLLAASGKSRGSKRSWEASHDVSDTDSGRRSKSPRLSNAQVSPNVDTPSDTLAPAKAKNTRTILRKNAKRDTVIPVERDEATAAKVKPVKAQKKSESTPLPVTRLLRSHARKATEDSKATSPPAPPPQARAGRAAATQRKGAQKATKNHQSVKAAAKIAEKVKSKTRKGR